MRHRLLSQGFALPTIVITSVVMFAVLVAAVSVVSSTRASLDTQYYEDLAADVAESGGAHANSCLLDNNYVATWGAKYLHPNTDCSGDASPLCTVAGCFVVNTTQYRSTYTADPAVDAGNGVQIVKITGKVELLRATGKVWATYTKTTNIRVGAQVTAQQLVLGYVSGGGSFFGVIGRDGVMRTVGYNGYGQLGNNTTTDTLTPTQFQAPTVYPIVAGYANFLSIGFNMFGIDSQGNVYGSGANDLGQLGIGNFTPVIKTPAKMILPVGVRAVFISPLGFRTTYVIGDDNNIYATGSCEKGLLGSNYTITGCSNRSSYVRVNLPAPNVSDPNTLPVAGSSSIAADNIVSDRLNTAVRMQGGRVYVWGDNVENVIGNAGNGPGVDVSSPIQLGTYGDAGQPKATQLAFDGDELYVLDNTGKVNVTGGNTAGSIAGAPAQIKHQGTGKCINNAYNSTTASQVRLYDCQDAVSQQITFNPLATASSYGTISTNPNPSDPAAALCLDDYAGATADNSPVYWYPCNGGVNQQWIYRDDGSLLNASSGKCLNDYNNTNANDAPLGIWTCNSAFSDQRWWLTMTDKLSPVPIPASAGAVKQIATDQWSVLFRTANNEVWGAGGNDRGQLCNGVVGKYTSPALTKVIGLPAGTVSYIYTTKSGVQGSDFANTYIIVNGSVYGCGSNVFGQLGNGTVMPVSVGTPVKMNLPPGVVATSVQSGQGLTVVLTAAGTVYTVGNNANGQIGDGTTINRSTPVLGQYINTQSALNY